jgi:hypothetical protein
MGKEILCDSSALISISDSCLAESLKFMADKYRVTFVITDMIEYECVKHPLDLDKKEYSLSALRIKDALEKRVLVKVAANFAIEKKRESLLALANNIFFVNGRPITLVQAGEAELLALASELRIRHLMMDERTTRLLIEAPFKIKEHMEQEFRASVMVHRENLAKFNDITRGIEVFRSAEFVTEACKNGFFKQYGALEAKMLEAALHRLRYAGCSIIDEEIAGLCLM